MFEVAKEQRINLAIIHNQILREVEILALEDVTGMGKKILNLFFEESSDDGDSKNIGYFAAFVFWGVILFINAVGEIYYGQTVIASSFMILMLGMTVFFVSEVIARKIRV